MLSDYCKILSSKHELNNGKVHKLIQNLNNKKHYVIHERTLKQAVDAGLILTNIYRVLQFNQSPWMKPYIDFNTAKRKEAKNDFEKDFFKLMNNSVYGKTMENVRNRQNIKLITEEKMLMKYLSKPGLINRKIFNENLVAVNMIREKLLLNKPIYVGFSILELSKNLMYDFHYGFIKKKYGKNAKLLFTDTDSLCYEIKTAKGIVKCVINKELKHDMYRDILESSGRMYSNMKVIRSQKHQIYTMEMSKVSLSAYDDKRYILEDGIHTLAYGHHKIQE